VNPTVVPKQRIIAVIAVRKPRGEAETDASRAVVVAEVVVAVKRVGEK
jgi:hypothetical protein